MDRMKFSAIAHRNHVFHSPLNEARVEELIELLRLSPGARVFDAGCGRAELLIRLVERYGMSGIGVDLSPHAIQQARHQARRRVPGADLAFYERTVAEFNAEPETFDLAMCIGSSQVYGDYRQTLQALREVVRPGGQILVGEGYWRREPTPRYLKLLGATDDELTTYKNTIGIGIEEGLTPLYVVDSTQEDWDRYEWLYLWSVEQYALEEPDDPDLPAILERGRLGRDRYLNGGRAILGFALFLFRK